jgi:hypothetical protein
MPRSSRVVFTPLPFRLLGDAITAPIPARIHNPTLELEVREQDGGQLPALLSLGSYGGAFGRRSIMARRVCALVFFSSFVSQYRVRDPHSWRQNSPSHRIISGSDT